jgi:hypothetical protein
MSGVALVGSLGSFLVRPLTGGYGFRSALVIFAALLLLAWPIAIWILRDKPSDLGQFPDGGSELEAEPPRVPLPFGALVRNWSFACCQSEVFARLDRLGR